MTFFFCGSLTTVFSISFVEGRKKIVRCLVSLQQTAMTSLGEPTTAAQKETLTAVALPNPSLAFTNCVYLNEKSALIDPNEANNYVKIGNMIYTARCVSRVRGHLFLFSQDNRDNNKIRAATAQRALTADTFAFVLPGRTRKCRSRILR